MDDNKADAKLSYTRQELSDPVKNAMLRPEEVALALQVMHHDGDNVAYFGINGCYLFSEFRLEVEGLQ